MYIYNVCVLCIMYYMFKMLQRLVVTKGKVFIFKGVPFYYKNFSLSVQTNLLISL